MIWHWSDTMNIAFSYPVSFISVILNVTLVCIALECTPSTMKTYSYKNSKTSILLIFHGPCQSCFSDRYFVSQFCLFFDCLLMYCAVGSNLIIFISLYFRQQAVSKPFRVIRRSFIIFVCLLLGIAVLTMTIITFVGNLYPLDVMDEVAHRLKPELINSKWIYASVVDIAQISQMPPNLCNITVSPILIVYGVICRWFVYRAMVSSNLSVAMKGLHRCLMNILLAQLLSPVISIVTWFLYGYSLSMKSDSPVMENAATFPMCIVLIISPTVTFYFVKPYRERFLAFFHLGRSSVIPISANTTNITD
ncbi:unnamed protein product [Caenorhabditis bovis]|uniref:Uncharacterized protein n=1 Tax=Caenorhabditis bovis TaxID=2654633 RepID=A0A8S1EPT2_9PELO|nr:unnamed protein product [Caenorhabditis bovis]